MPKKNGVSKTFSFDKEVVAMLDDLCKAERRTQTNLIETLIVERMSKMESEEMAYGKKRKTKD